MTDPVPSKDIVTRLRDEFDSQLNRFGEEDSDDRAMLASDAVNEIERLRTALRGIQSCSTCEACRRAATLALGGAAPEPLADLLEASQRVSAIALDAAGKHAERVIELEAEVSTLREHLAEQNRLLSLNVAEVERLKASWYEGAPDKEVISKFVRLKQEGKL